MGCGSVESVCPLGVQVAVICLSDRCNLRCGHCAVESGPDREDEIDLETGRRYVAEIAAAGFRAVWFSGGEPMLRPAVVLRLTRDAKSRGLKVVLGTNGYWGRDPEKCRETMEALREAGLDSISLSTDQWHEPFVPLVVIQNVVEAARENNLKIQLSVTRAVTDEYADEVQRVFKGQGVPVNIQKLSRVGRARAMAEDMAPPNWERGEASCLFSFVPQITPDGSLFACCGPRLSAGKDHPLWLGSLQAESLSEILCRAHADPLLAALQVLGSHRLLSRLYPEPEWEELRANAADPCAKCAGVWSDSRIVEGARARLKGREDIRLLVKAVNVVLYDQFFKMRDAASDFPEWLSVSSLKNLGELRYSPNESGGARDACGV